MSAQRIKELRQRKRMTLLEVAKALGVSEGTVQRYESGNIRNLKYDTIVKLATIFDCTPAYLMGWDDKRELKFDLFDAPVYEAAAGEGRLNDGYPTETVSLKLEADQKLFRIKGRSMEPTLLDGDIVVISAQSVVDHTRQMALVKVNGEEHTVKRVEVRPDGVLLIGDNIDVYSPRFFTRDDVENLPVRIEGVVVRLVRDL